MQLISALSRAFTKTPVTLSPGLKEKYQFSALNSKQLPRVNFPPDGCFPAAQNTQVHETDLTALGPAPPLLLSISYADLSAAHK